MTNTPAPVSLLQGLRATEVAPAGTPLVQGHPAGGGLADSLAPAQPTVRNEFGQQVPAGNPAPKPIQDKSTIRATPKPADTIHPHGIGPDGKPAEFGNLDVGRAIDRAIDKPTEPIENYTQQGRAEHPILSRIGDVTRNAKELLEGAPGQIDNSGPGLLNSPITQSLFGVDDAVEFLTEAEGLVSEYAPRTVEGLKSAGRSVIDALAHPTHAPVPLEGNPEFGGIRVNIVSDPANPTPPAYGDMEAPKPGMAAKETPVEKPKTNIESTGPDWERLHTAKTEEGQHAGSVGVKIDPYGRAQVFGSNVQPELRGKGIGQDLYRSAIEDARAKGAHTISSDPTNVSEDANRVWQKLGEKGYPVTPVTQPNGKPGYEIDLKNSAPPAKSADGSSAGIPLYHASSSETPFENFNPLIGGNEGEFGTHLGSIAQANDRASTVRDYAPAGKTPPVHIRPVYADIKNPLRLEGGGINWTPLTVVQRLERAGLLTKSEYSTLNNWDVQDATHKYGIPNAEDLRNFLEKKGYDGIVYHNQVEGLPTHVRAKIDQELEDEGMWREPQTDAEQQEEHPETKGNDSYIAFRPEQIKPRFASVPAAEEPVSPNAAPEKTPFSGTHYSDHDAADGTLSGGARGTGRATGAEKSRLQEENKVPGVYAYREGVPPESQVKNGKFQHSIKGDKAIADISGDQKDLFVDAVTAAREKYTAAGDAPGVAQSKALNDGEAALRDAGFDGYENGENKKNGVFLFGDQEVAQKAAPPAKSAESASLDEMAPTSGKTAQAEEPASIYIHSPQADAAGVHLNTPEKLQSWANEYSSDPDTLAKSLAGKKVAMLDDLNVAPAFRGKGLGSQTYEDFESTAKKQGADTIALVAANESNPKGFDLEKWYQDRGFETVGHTRVHPSDVGKHDGYPIMVKTIEPTHWSEDAATKLDQNGGFTHNPQQGDLAGTDNYAVAAHPERSVTIPGTATAEHIRDFAEKNKDLLADPNKSIGGWRDPQGNTALDIVHTIPDREEAIALGKQNNQQAIFNLKDATEIDTGGTGEYKAPGETISTRVPTAQATKNFTPEDAMQHGLKVEASKIYDVPGHAEKIANQIKDIPGFTAPEGADAKGTIDAFTNHVKDNLKWLYNQSTPEEQTANKGWYDGAHNLTKDLASDYGLDHRKAAGVVAALSPQKDWDQNVSLAERVIDINQMQKETVTSPEMIQRGKDIVANTGANSKLDELIPGLAGKKYGDLKNNIERAAWIRLYDEVNNERSYSMIGPDGSKLGNAKTATGADRRVAWGSLNEIAKAISILDDGSRENISKELGSQHKVRSFYNNIIEPNSERGDATIDTHAVAAGLLRPLGGNSRDVINNFSGAGSAKTGLSGTYPVYQDAYTKAAKELGIDHPRQLQSVAWAKVRRLFPAEFKNELNQAQVDSIWNEAKNGKITADEARQRILDFANSRLRPTVDAGAQGAGDSGELSQGSLFGGGAGNNPGARSRTSRNPNALDFMSALKNLGSEGSSVNENAKPVKAPRRTGRERLGS